MARRHGDSSACASRPTLIRNGRVDGFEFERLSGRAEIWLDGQLLGRKDDTAVREFSLALPPGEGERELSVLIESPPGSASGFVSAMIDSKETGK